MEKITQALKDFTVEENGSNDETGWEAVLCLDDDESGDSSGSSGGAGLIDKGDAQPSPKRTSRTIKADLVLEDQEDLRLLDMIRREQWLDVLCRLEEKPETAHVKFDSHTQQSSGNLVLHECCRHGAPSDVVECFLQGNPDAVTAKGNSGYLPMHYACATCSPSIDVVRLLFTESANALCQFDEEEQVLPLHLACKVGADTEVLMLLLSFYPEAIKQKDVFDRSPLDYAKSIRDENVRESTLRCLEQAKWMMSAASFARTRTETQYERRVQACEHLHSQYLERVNEIHGEEIVSLQLIVKGGEKELLKKKKMIQILNTTIQVMEKERSEQIEIVQSLEDIIKHQKGDLQQHTEKIRSLEATIQHQENDVQNHTNKIKQLTTTIQHQKEGLKKQNETIQGLTSTVQAKKKNSQKQIDTLQSILKVKDEAAKKQATDFDTEKKKLRTALGHQESKLAELMNTLTTANERNKTLADQLAEREYDLDAALDDIEALNKHSDWLESTIHSIREQVDEKDSPLVSSLLSRHDEQQPTTPRIGDRVRRRSRDGKNVAAVANNKDYVEDDETDSDLEGYKIDQYEVDDEGDLSISVSESVSASISSCEYSRINKSTTTGFKLETSNSSSARSHRSRGQIDVEDDREIPQQQNLRVRQSVDQGDNVVILNGRE